MSNQIASKDNRDNAQTSIIGASAVESVTTFAEIAQKWIHTRNADTSLAVSTRRSNECVVTKWMIPAFGHMAISTITGGDIEQFLSRLRRQLTSDTVAIYYRMLRMIVRQAIQRGWYRGPNPLERCNPLPMRAPSLVEALTVDEARRLLGELSGQLRYKVGLALHTGLRWGEIHGLSWDDLTIDSAPWTLTVRRNYNGRPKNEASTATIPLSRDAVSVGWLRCSPRFWVYRCSFDARSTSTGRCRS